MEIVDVEHAAAGEHVLAQRVDVDVARRGFEEHVDRLAQQAERPRHDERDDQERRECVGELTAGEDVRERRDDHGDRGRDVGEHVEVRGADSERGVRIAEEIDRDAVTDEAGRGHDEDDVALHMRGLAEPAQSLDEHHRRDHEEKHRIEHRREDLQAQEAERPAIGDRTGPEPHRHKRDSERDHVDEDVECLRQ